MAVWPFLFKICLLFIFSILQMKFIKSFRSNQQVVECNITEISDAWSAYNRAKTKECRSEIETVACLIKQQEELFLKYDFLSSDFYKMSLKTGCPLISEENHVYSCLTKDELDKYTTLLKNNSDDDILARKSFSNVKTAHQCMDMCLSYFNYAAFNLKSKICECLKKFEQNQTENSCNSKDGDFYLLYETKQLVYKTKPKRYDKPNETQSIDNNHVRIAFFLTVNGRSVRQLFRLIKSIYDERHFYYFHIDQRMHYLRKELSYFISKKNVSNFYLPDWSVPTIWGGATLLDMHLKAMKEMLDMKQSGRWDWDFVLNLSETDFPIKSVKELAWYLSKYRNKNFIKLNDNDIQTFSKKQGLEKVFVQCEDRMWRVGTRSLPIGVQFAGGSDWFCLNHDFIEYVVNSNDELLINLKVFFKNVLLPSETFFQTVIFNSKFCDSYENTNLKYVNWKRERGCNCESKKVVDWCGCSPNYFSLDDFDQKIKSLKNKPIFFARKFDALSNNQLLNMVDQSIYGIYSADFKSLNSYWHNLYDHEDSKQIESKFHLLFLDFIYKSIDCLLEKMGLSSIQSASNYYFQMLKHLNKIKRDSYFDFLRAANAFFEANKFKGFVLNMNIKKDINLQFEVFFTQTNVESVFEIKDLKNLSEECISLSKYFQRSIIYFHVSSDYNSREKRFDNFFNVLDQKTNPTVLIEIDVLEKPLEFFIMFRDPNDKVVKESVIKLNASHVTQTIVYLLFKQNQVHFVNQTGIWKVQLGSTVNKEILISRKFLVLLSNISNVSDQIRNQINEFWELDSLCFQSIENMSSNYSILYKDMFKDCVQTHWSTYYPDPKSDLYESLNVDFEHRIT